jgi:hypothetical protein
MLTPDQEFQLFEHIGSIKTTLETMSKDTRILKEVINGNGHPEEGMVYRLSMVERQQLACPIAQVAADVAEIKTQQKVSDAGNWLNRVWKWAKAKPQFSVPLGIALLGSMGFSVDKIINMLITVREIAEKLGIK